jgi:erythronate-4-phosphate dehydrogenase
MKIIADELIPFVVEAFSPLGEVTTHSGRSISAEMVRDADALIVRSITEVNESLLGGSSVRFVASATIGTDHVDHGYLKEAGIGFSNAPGSNANAVAEYVVAALLEAAEGQSFELAGMTIGVVGVGNVGRRVVEKVSALGMNVLACDPPRERAEGGDHWRTLDYLLSASDVITFHTPLVREGPDATFHLLNRKSFDRIKKNTLVINTSRGPVIDNRALMLALQDGGPLSGAVMDVWENEPLVPMELLVQTLVGTAHIAGYSYDGKIAATKITSDAACKHFGRAPCWTHDWPPAPVPLVEMDRKRFRSDQACLRAIVRRVYSIQKDDDAFRQMLNLPTDHRLDYFDTLRRQYPKRREFHWTTVRVDNGSPEFHDTLRSLGFQLGGESMDGDNI